MLVWRTKHVAMQLAQLNINNCYLGISTDMTSQHCGQGNTQVAKSLTS